MGNTESLENKYGIKAEFIGEALKLQHFKKGIFIKEIQNEIYG